MLPVTTGFYDFKDDSIFPRDYWTSHFSSYKIAIQIGEVRELLVKSYKETPYEQFGIWSEQQEFALSVEKCVLQELVSRL